MNKHRKINVAILFGGKSAEHEVSLQSAKNIIAAIDKTKYNPILIKINKNGQWLLGKDHVALIPECHGKILNLSNPKKKLSVDVVFPILHGPFGEDGTVQGLLKLANIPFVGAGVLGSAVGMDKDITKRLLREANIPVAKYLTFSDKFEIKFVNIVEILKLPFFVKPANLGSSVGISKVRSKQAFDKATREAFSYDRKIIIEENIQGREIECSVLGNDKPIATIPGEIVPNDEFYSYKAKYIDESGAKLIIPTKLDKKLTKKVQDLAIKTFKTLNCEGMARVDFFLKQDGTLLVNEINTIPGFTSISMYPMLWKASGIEYGKLIDQLIKLAIKRFKEEQQLRTSY